jgi:cardiolipin synthase
VSAEIKPPLISKVNTALQLFLMAACLAASSYGYLHHPLMVALEYTVATTTVLSGLHYFLKE